METWGGWENARKDHPAKAHARRGGVDLAGNDIDADDLRQEDAEVFLFHLELAYRRGDLRRRKNCRRHLIE
jgi:hypothetical protein